MRKNNLPYRYKPRSRFDCSVRMEDCRASVGRGRVGAGQCYSIGKHPVDYPDEKGVLFCKTHHPTILTKAQQKKIERDAKKEVALSNSYAISEKRHVLLGLIRSMDLNYIGNAKVRKAAEAYRKACEAGEDT